MFPEVRCHSKEMKQAVTTSKKLYYLFIAFYLHTDFLLSTTVLILLGYFYGRCDFKHMGYHRQ